MFEYIRGVLAEKHPTMAVVECAGVGYAVEIPVSTFDKLPAVEDDVKLLMHHYVREDVQRLYGFASSAEREIFRKLLGISNVGPKAALSILSSISVKDILYAVSAQDSSRFKSAPGIGTKTAQRLVMELNGKLKIKGFDIDSTSGDSQKSSEAFGAQEIQSDASAALISLGYSEVQVQRALVRVAQAINPDSPVEDWIKKALQVI